MMKKRKKRLLGVACAMALAMGVSAQTSGLYTIRGTLMGGVNGDTIILAVPNSGGLTALDTSIVKGGTFEFSGQVEGAQLVVLVGMRDRQVAYGTSMVAEPGSINVRMYKETGREADVVGNMTNSLWRLFAVRDGELVEESQPYVNMLKRPGLAMVARKSYLSTLDSLTTLRMANVVEFVSGHKETLAADMVFEMYAEALNETDRRRLMALLATNRPALPGYARVRAKEAQAAAAQATGAGVMFTDFSCKDMKGKEVKLSDVVRANRVTLVDFWASWCGPCRMEMPTVRRAYELYKGKGLEVVGVSLDSNRQSWEGAVKSLGMTWIQLSDLKGWQCGPAVKYGVHSIPSCVLIGQDGRIIGRDYRGEALIEAIGGVVGM